MVIRKTSTVAAVCLFMAAVAVGQNQGTSYVFQLPGAGNGASNIIGYVSTGNPLSPTINATGPQGAYQIIPKPDGSKFYILATGPGSPGTPAIQIADPTFTNFHTVNGLGAAPTLLAITPDGKHAIVAAGNVYVIDTGTDQIVGSPLLLSGTAVGVAFSRDSSTAYVLVNSNSGSQVIAFGVLTQKPIGTALGISGGATYISMSPLGLLYATAVNRIYEIDPSTMQETTNGVIQLTASPGPFRYTTDGLSVYFVNQTPATGGVSLLKMSLDSNHVLQTWAGGGLELDDVYIADPTDRIFVYSSTTQIVYDVNPTNLTVSPSTLTSTFAGTGVLGIALSSELPTARYMFAVVNNGTYAKLERIDLSTNLVSVQQFPVTNVGNMIYVAVPPESGAGGFLTYNTTQTLTAGATSAPLIARILDSTGRPLYNEPYTFSLTSGTGVTIAAATGVTTDDGYAITTVTMPSTPATYTVTLTAESATTPFTLTIPGATNPGGNPNSSPQMTIVSGDGQIVIQNQVSTFPLIVQVTDPTGAPIANAVVNFSLDATALSAVFPTQTTTDQNGLAQASYEASVPGGGASFETDTVTASSSVGTVVFTETSTQTIFDDPTNGLPNIIIDAPLLSTTPLPRTVTLPVGTPVPNAIVAEIYSQEGLDIGQPMPGVGLIVVNPNDPYMTDAKDFPVPASCVGSSDSNSNGKASCTLIASCQAGLGLLPFDFWVGGLERFTNNFVNITAGTAAKLSILNGNNQTGTAGQTLSTALSATISNGCGTLVGAGTPVTWTVTQGTATLVNTVSTSNSSGQVSTSVTLGASAGVVKVQLALTGTTQTVTFTLTNQITVSSMVIASGNNQTALTGSQFAQPLVAQVLDNNGHGVPGLTVNFSITGGSVGLSDGKGNAITTATTDAGGNATIYATAGSVAGPISVLASYNSFSVTFNLTGQAQGPSITAASFINAAFNPISRAAAGLTPCGLVSVQGNGLAPSIQGIVAGDLFGPLPYTLSGVSLTVNGVAAPIYSVSNVSGTQQVTFQTPCGTAPGTATVVVTSNGGTTTVNNVAVSAAQPGIFNYISNNKPYGWVIDSNGNTVTTANPAVRGGTYFAIVTGLGQTTPAMGTNSVGEFGVTQPVNTTVLAGANVYGVPMISAQYLFGSIGMYLVEFQIPTTFPTGPDQNFVIAVLNGSQETFSNSVLLPAIQ